MAKPPNLDHSFVYLTLQGTPISSPELEYVRPVGELPDVSIYKVIAGDRPVKRDTWDSIREDFLARVRAMEGVKRVDEVQLKQRAKRTEL